MKFTDIHCHIIPQVDDGSDSINTSIKLAQMMYDDGIRNVICTPHFGIINPSYDPDKVTEKFELLSNEIKKIYPDMNLYRGNELFIAPAYSDGLDDEKSCTLAGSNYVLVEFDDDVDYDTVCHEFRKLLIRGYFPIWAHAERYIHVFRTVKELRPIVEQGVMIQVNSSSICSLSEPVKHRLLSGKSNAAVLREMLTEGLVHFVATDCHDMVGREPRMTEASKVLEEIIGKEKTREIMVDNPMMIIESLE